MRSKALCAILLLSVAGRGQSAFVNFESGPVHPVRLSPDGSRLFVCNAAGGMLSVFDLRNPQAPLLLTEIPVGLDPVSVQPRTDDEVWVANLLSDSVSIVSLEQGCVVASLRVPDEPSDIAFASGLAFVTTATTDEVQVFDALTRVPVATVPIGGKDPRALAVSPDGRKVYAVVQRSGNGTTVIRDSVAPLPPPPTNPALPPAPRQGIIVRADNPVWAAQIPFTLPDNDVAEIDVATRTVTRYFRAVGTTNTGIAVHPTTGDLWVANTDARNLIRFEPNLRGHVIDSRLTRITTGNSPNVTAYDLNRNLDYGTLPNPSALATALAEPFDVAIDAQAHVVYVAAQGTDRIGVVDFNGHVTARIEVGGTPGNLVDTHHKRGPRGLALHAAARKLYVYNRLSDTLSIVDTASRTLLAELPIASHDPMPPAIRTGRRFLYDSKLSGNGTMSCAACHVDGDTDGLSWDLGDPAGSMQAPPVQPFPFNSVVSFHPMKGPMQTQTLRGLDNTEPLHWRGDRQRFQDFAPAFASLLGGSQPPVADMDLYAGFGTSIAFPPNPNQPLDRSWSTAPPNNNQLIGFQAFQAPIASLPQIGPASCSTCHTLPRGTNRMVINAQVIMTAQQIKVPQLRNLYRKVGFARAPGPQKSGFGFTHDGSVDSLTSFLNQPQFTLWPGIVKDDLVSFLLAYDTGTAPLVGCQVTVTQANVQSPAVIGGLGLLTARAGAGDVDLVAKGLLDGRRAGLLYQPATALWFSDRVSEGPFTPTALVTKILLGNALLTLTCVPPGTGRRLGIDRDLDGVLDGDEGVFPYGEATAGCRGRPQLDANSVPRPGNAQFAMVASLAAPGAPGFLLAGMRPGTIPLAGITVLVDLTRPTQLLFLQADAHGQATARLPLPAEPSLAGAWLFAQVFWSDGCAPTGFSSSRGLALTVQP